MKQERLLRKLESTTSALPGGLFIIRHLTSSFPVINATATRGHCLITNVNMLVGRLLLLQMVLSTDSFMIFLICNFFSLNCSHVRCRRGVRVSRAASISCLFLCECIPVTFTDKYVSLFLFLTTLGSRVSSVSIFVTHFVSCANTMNNINEAFYET